MDEKFVAKRIVTDLDVLRKQSVEISLPPSEEHLKLIDYMKQYLIFSNDPEFATVHKMRAGVGLSAIQLGHALKIFVVYIKQGNDTFEKTFINPQIISHSLQVSYLNGGESCLSVKEDHKGLVHRYAWIKLKYYDIEKKEYVVEKFFDFKSIVLQHELDHMIGKLYYDSIDNKPDPNAKIVD